MEWHEVPELSQLLSREFERGRALGAQAASAALSEEWHVRYCSTCARSSPILEADESYYDDEIYDYTCTLDHRRDGSPMSTRFCCRDWSMRPKAWTAKRQ
jgi:hypothetical protein